MNWNEQGGAAFPIPHSSEPGAYEAECGMSLRDWFAGQALAGMCGHPRALSQIQDGDLMADARLMFRIADAMLSARSAK